MDKVLTSRRFWTLLVDTLVSLALYFVGKYAAPALTDDVKFGVMVLQPVVALLIVAYTVDDVNAARLDAHVQVKLAELSAVGR